MTLKERVEGLERRQRRGYWIGGVISGVATLLLLVGAGPGMPGPLIGTSLSIVNDSGTTVLDCAAGSDGVTRLHLRTQSGAPEVVIAAGPQGGTLDLLNPDGRRLVRLGPSPSGDGMVVLCDDEGDPLWRAGRWIAHSAPTVWMQSASPTSTPTP